LPLSQLSAFLAAASMFFSSAKAFVSSAIAFFLFCSLPSPLSFAPFPVSSSLSLTAAAVALPHIPLE